VGRFVQSNTANGDGVLVQIGSTASSDYALTVRSDGGNTPVLSAKADGNVGIGTFSPKRHLHINDPSAVATKIQITNSATGSGSDGDGFQIGIGSVGQAAIEQRENQPLSFSTNNTERMRIDSSGNVGIGTSSPSATLTVSQGANNIFAVERTGVGSGSGQFGINIESNSQTTMSYDDGAPLVIGTASNPSTHVGFTERMRIDSAGRVTMPYQPAFHAYDGGDKTSDGIVVFSTASTNISNSYNTSNGRFTAPVGGTYKFSARIMKIATSGSSTVDFHFRKNGVQIVNNLYDLSATSGQHSSGTINYIVTLSSGDYVEVYTASTTSTNKVHAGHREFTGFLVG
jgi:hypothetical protein